MKLACSSEIFASFYPFTIPCYTFEETINRIADIGYDGIEITTSSPHVYPKYVDSEERKRYKRLIEDRGLEVAAIVPMLGGPAGYNIASCLEAERKETIEYYKECMGLTEDFGGKILLFYSGYVTFGTPYEKAWKWLIDGLKAISEDAERAGVTIAIEPLDQSETNLILSADDALRAMREVNHKNVRVMMDVFHVVTNLESPADYVKRIGKDLVYVHIGDTERRIPGKGEVNWKVFIDALKKIGYDGWLCVEVFGRDPVGIAQQSYEYLRKLI